MSFARHPCFIGGDIGITAMGAACRRLSDVLAAHPDARDARLALGDPFSSERNARALKILQGLPPRMQAKILSADAGRRSDPSERGGRA